jgi:Trk K+ transport system NAD-binding subunit
MLGHGDAGRYLLRPLQKAGYDVLVVDDDPLVIRRLQEAKVSCLRGDASDDAILLKAGAARARFIVASLRRAGDAVRVLKHVRGVPIVGASVGGDSGIEFGGGGGDVFGLV